MEAAFAPTAKRSVMPVSVLQERSSLVAQIINYSLISAFVHTISVSLTGGAASFCAITCCDSQTEEACYDYDDDGNFKTQYCAPVRYYTRPG